MGRALRGVVAMALLVGTLVVVPTGSPPAGASPGSPGWMHTVAGTGVGGPAGDGGPAVDAQLWFANGIDADAGGNLFIADTGVTVDIGNHAIRRVDANTGIITRYAGDGSGGYGGDGGPAPDAQLNFPEDVVVASTGEVYIADKMNHRVRRVDIFGTITTIAGDGNVGLLDAVGDGGQATLARLNRPHALALDEANGHLYLAEEFGNRVRRVDLTTGVITRVTGTSSPGFSGDGGPALGAEVSSPRGLDLDGQGGLLIADHYNQRIRRVDLLAGTIDTVVGSGPAGSLEGSYGGDGGLATSARLHNPRDVTVDDQGHIYIADQNRVRRVHHRTGIISTIAGTGGPGNSPFDGLAIDTYIATRGLTVIGDRLYIAQGSGHRVRQVTLSPSIIETVAGNGTPGYSGDGASAVEAQLNHPFGVAVAPDDSVVIADAGNHAVRRLDPITRQISAVAGTGVAGFSGDGGPASNAQLNSPHSVAVDSAGNLFVTERSNHRVRRVDAASGVITTVVGTGVAGFSGDGGPASGAQLNDPHGVAVDSIGNVFVADRGNHRVRRVDAASGVIATVVGTGVAGFSGDGGPASGAQLNDPGGVAVDKGGNLLIADWINHRIRRVDTDGTISTLAGTGSPVSTGDGGTATAAGLNTPTDVVVGPAGEVFIPEFLGGRIRVIDPTGTIDTLAGDGSAGFYRGDGGPPGPFTQFTLPASVAVDSHGDLFIVDLSNHVVRWVEAPPVDVAMGLLRVTTSPALPASIIVDGVPRDSWGLNWVPFPPGTVEVCFGPAPAMSPPPCETVELVAGATTEVVGEYQTRGYLQVVTDPALPATISIGGQVRNDWGVWTDVQPGTYEVCFGLVADQAPPPCQQATVTAGSNTVVTGQYTPSPGAPGRADAHGFLRAVTDPPVASRISVGGVLRDSWSLTWLKSAPGNREVCFESVLYADAPPCETVPVVAGETAVVTGSFVTHGFLRVLTEPAVPATIFVDGHRANVWGVWTSMPPGERTVCFGGVAGLATPACEVVSVTAGETTTLTGTYGP